MQGYHTNDTIEKMIKPCNLLEEKDSDTNLISIVMAHE